MPAIPMPIGPPLSALARAVVQGSPATDLVPELHREALTLSGGSSSVIVERSGRTGNYVATSGCGLPTLAGLWLRAQEARTLEQLGARGITWCDLSELPALASRLGAPRALVMAVGGPSRPAFLIIGGSTFAEHAGDLAQRTRVEFWVALELARLARQAELHRKIQDLLLRFSRGVSATLTLHAALEPLAQEANTLFGTRRTRVWLHDRRARELVLAAASDGSSSALGERVGTDSDAPAARGLRLDRAQEMGSGEDPILVVPLRGWRRALGTLIFEGDPTDLDDRQFEQAAHELGRQLSVSVENVLLLDDVLQQRRLLENTFNALVDLVVVVDNNLRIVESNDAFNARVGATRTSLQHRPVSELVGEDMARWMAEDRRRGRARVAARAASTQQFTDSRLNGTFSATVTPLLNQDGEPVGRVLVARDITRQLRLEAEREGLRERLAQSEKLASLGQFVAGIAHEMNNPLQGVLGHLELLMETSTAAKPLRRELRRIYQEGDRAARIVRNLLVFAGKRRAGRERVRVDRIVARAVASHNAVLRRAGIQVTRQQDAKAIATIQGDALLLQQAFLNVIVNAEHAIASTGSPGRIAITIERSRDSVVTRIRDSGPGIPATALPKIFDPFFTTKDVGQGTGLGLAIAYGIVQEHGGTISGRNAPGGGAEFTITLPAAAGG